VEMSVFVEKVLMEVQFAHGVCREEKSMNESGDGVRLVEDGGHKDGRGGIFRRLWIAVYLEGDLSGPSERNAVLWNGFAR